MSEKIRELGKNYADSALELYKAGIALMDKWEEEWAKENVDPNVVAVCKLECGKVYKTMCKKEEADVIRRQVREAFEILCLKYFR
jgi:hypothetical protein